MSLFKNLFSKKETAESAEKSDSFLRFGHYTDANKNAFQLKRWDDANAFFKSGDYKSSFMAFLDYLADTTEKNVTWDYRGSDLHFTVHQGSVEVRGIYNGKTVTAQCFLAEFEKPPIAVMRQLLAANFTLNYSKFAIEGNRIGIFFSSPVTEASPNKMYFALREIALRADKQDDAMQEEFDEIKSLHALHEKTNPEIAEKKYAAWKKWSEEALTFFNTQDKQYFAGIISYTLLNLFYKTDYLLSPQGHFMNELTRIQHIYWNKQDTRTDVEKNDDMVRNLKALLEKPKEYFINSFYEVKSTFGITTATSSQTVANYLGDCLKNTDWYVQHKHQAMEITIYEYAATYCLFHYGMYPAHYKLFKLFLQIHNEPFFKDLGIEIPYMVNGELKKDKITKRIHQIIEEEKTVFKNFEFRTANLKFNTIYDFYYSFLAEIQFLNFTK
ncbi:MAG: YbjN domain-containing protein [Flavobacteriales bacterium]|nr:YbjN domain-containing protein [Flavobacteriales bacterium]